MTTDPKSPDLNRLATSDEVAGMTWWNALDVVERAAWLAETASGTVADAWAAYKALHQDAGRS